MGWDVCAIYFFEATAMSARAIRRFIGPAVLVMMVVQIMHGSLFSGGRFVPTKPNTDLHLQFLGWRYFGFTQWMHGQFPFWNPHVFCGMPFFAQLQSDLLYPIAWANFLCNTVTATTIELAANVTVAALCAYAWGRQRGISRCGASLAGAAFAFSGPVYLRVMAGHLSPLASVAWTPLVFMGVDRLLAEQFLAGILIERGWRLPAMSPVDIRNMRITPCSSPACICYSNLSAGEKRSGCTLRSQQSICSAECSRLCR